MAESSHSFQYPRPEPEEKRKKELCLKPRESVVNNGKYNQWLTQSPKIGARKGKNVRRVTSMPRLSSSEDSVTLSSIKSHTPHGKRRIERNTIKDNLTNNSAHLKRSSKKRHSPRHKGKIKGFGGPRRNNKVKGNSSKNPKRREASFMNIMDAAKDVAKDAATSLLSPKRASQQIERSTNCESDITLISDSEQTTLQSFSEDCEPDTKIQEQPMTLPFIEPIFESVSKFNEKIETKKYGYDKIITYTSLSELSANDLKLLTESSDDMKVTRVYFVTVTKKFTRQPALCSDESIPTIQGLKNILNVC